MNAYPTHLQAASAEPQLPDGTFKNRMRALASQASEFDARLRVLLDALRCPPPPAPTQAGTLGVIDLRFEDFLGRAEISHGSINDALNELEGLLR